MCIVGLSGDKLISKRLLSYIRKCTIMVKELQQVLELSSINTIKQENGIKDFTYRLIPFSFRLTLAKDFSISFQATSDWQDHKCLIHKYMLLLVGHQHSRIVKHFRYTSLFTWKRNKRRKFLLSICHYTTLSLY